MYIDVSRCPMSGFLDNLFLLSVSAPLKKKKKFRMLDAPIRTFKNYLRFISLTVLCAIIRTIINIQCQVALTLVSSPDPTLKILGSGDETTLTLYRRCNKNSYGNMV